MKAITTKFVGPTNSRGARIIARAEGLPALTVSYDYGAKDAHRDAARAFAERQGWRFTFASGGLPNGDHVHVMVFADSPGSAGTTWTIPAEE